jgi:hypothetical protein
MTAHKPKKTHPWNRFIPGWLAGQPKDAPSYQDKPRGTANRKHGRLR